MKDIVNKVHCADCLEFMKRMENESVDMVFCDYPFNCQDGRKDYVEFINDLSIEFYRILKENCVLLIINNPPNIHKTKDCYNQFTYRDSIALIRKGSLRPAWRFGFQHNYLMTFVKGTDKRFKWNGAKKNHDKSFMTDVINYQNGYRGKGKAWHPQAFPLELTRKFISIFSNKDDIILDPFFGSGTTGVACKTLKRKFIGIELYTKYVLMAEGRINTLKEKLF